MRRSDKLRGWFGFLSALLMFFASTFAQAEEDYLECEEISETEAMSQVKKTAVRVLQEATFQHCEEIYTYEEKDKETDRDVNSPPEWLAELVRLFAQGFEGVLWVLAGLGIAALVYYLTRLRPRWVLPEKKNATPQPQVILGMDVQPESIPNDVPEGVWALWQDQQHRAALSLLYRCALSRLLTRGAQFEESFTEGDCRCAVSALHDPPLNQYFAALTLAWQQLAYAHRLPTHDEVQRLCEQWPHVMMQEAQPGV